MHQPRKLAALLAVTAALCAPLAASAAAYTVPDHFSTIQEAVNAAAPGDVVFVRPGVYFENVVVINKSLTLQSLKGAAQTVLDGRKLGATVRVAGSANVNITGFTIQGGTPAGVWYNLEGNAGPSGEIRNSVIVNNDAGIYSDGAGGSAHPHLWVYDSVVANNTVRGGIYTHMACTYVYNTVIASNHSVEGGGGLFVYHAGYVDVNNSFITGNTSDRSGGGVQVISSYNSLRISNSVIDRNTAAVSGGGIDHQGTSASLTGSTVTNNVAPVGGGLSQSAWSTLNVTNSIVWGNATPPSLGNPASASISYSDIEGGLQPGAGNIDADPRFVNGAAGNYQLFAGSPAIDTGAPGTGGADLIGIARPQGAVADLGAYEWTEAIPPVSTATVTGTVGANGIYTTAATVAITAEDLYGVREIHYVVNGAETVVPGPTASFTLAASGTHAVTWFAVDNYGNPEAVKALSVTVDVDAPVVTGTTPANGSIGFARGGNVLVTFSEAVTEGPQFGAIALLRGTTGVALTATISGGVLTLDPVNSLGALATYTVTIPAGAVVDAAGTPSATATTFTFTTK